MFSTCRDIAELLVLRRDTFRVIDGAGPDALVPERNGATPARINETMREQEATQENEQQPTTELRETAKEQVETSGTSHCTFSGVVPIDIKRFAESSVAVVECPDCGRTRSLSPSKEGVIRFPPHKPRRRQMKVSGVRWSRNEKTGWNMVGG